MRQGVAPRWARCTGHQGGRGQGGGEHHGHEVGAQRPELVCVLDRLEREPRDAVHARHTASRSEEERVGRGCEKAKMKSELRPLNFCGASATATVKARRSPPLRVARLGAVASAARSSCPHTESRSFREWGCAGSRGWWLGSLLQLGTRQIGRGGARARTRGAKPTEQGGTREARC